MQLKSRSLGMAATALAVTGLLAGVAFASADASGTKDTDPTARGADIAKLARSTTLTDKAKGDAISAAAKAEAKDADRDEDTDTDTDEDTDEDKDNDENETETDNDSHGDTVSALAKSTAPGTEHGETVSATARKGNHSK